MKNLGNSIYNLLKCGGNETIRETRSFLQKLVKMPDRKILIKWIEIIIGNEILKRKIYTNFY